MKKVIDKLKMGGSYILLPHVNMDGDALGSCLALYEIITALGGSARIVAEEKVSFTLSFLAEKIEIYSEDENYKCDCAVAVDCGDLKRLGKRSVIFENAAHTVCIDHHMTNEGGFADAAVVEPDAAATGEIVYDIAKEAGINIEGKAADYIYTAIVSDTGGFRYSNTTEKTLNIAASLVSGGVDSAKICTLLFDNKKLSQARLEAAVINSASFLAGGAFAIVCVSEKMLEECGAEYEDADALSAILRGISGVLVAAVIKEKEGSLKLSMRSKNVDISGVCTSLGGGGHRFAAGASSTGAMEDFCDKVIELTMPLLEKD